MIALHMSCVTLCVLAVLAAQVYSDEPASWFVDAFNSVKEASLKVKSFGVKDEKIKMIADESFDSFTSFVEKDLSELIKQIDDKKSEEVLVLKSKVAKWLEDVKALRKDPNVIPEETNNIALGKFLVTMEYVSREVLGFYQNYNFQSYESKQTIEQINLMIKKTVDKLVENAKSVENQVSGLIGVTKQP